MALPEGASKAIRESVGLVEGSDWTESRSLARGEGGRGRKGREMKAVAWAADIIRIGYMSRRGRFRPYLIGET